MRFLPILGAAAVALSVPAIAAAQYSSQYPSGAPSTGAPPATSPPPAAGAAAMSGAVTPGLPVKDKTGANIGQVTDVKADASGKQVATIRMGADTFAVDTSALAVDNGAATINATQAELKAMLPKKK